jgi:hypothetical protein
METYISAATGRKRARKNKNPLAAAAARGK